MSFSRIRDLGNFSIGGTHQRTDFIHLGEKPDGSHPRSTLEFQLPESLLKYFPQPTACLPILLPMNDIEEFLPQYWEWEPIKDGKPYRVCIGEGGNGSGMRLSKQDWKFHETGCLGWNCPEVKNGKCRRVGLFSIYVDCGLDESLKLYQIKTHSGHTLKTINVQVEGFKKIPMFNGDISFIPLWLTRLEKTVTDGENKKRSIHYLSLSLRFTIREALIIRLNCYNEGQISPPIDLSPNKAEAKPESKSESKPETPSAQKKTEPKITKPGAKKVSREPQEAEFLEKAHDYLQKINDLNSEKATIEVNDVFGEYSSPEELLDAMEIGGLITCVNQLVGIWRNRKNADDVEF